MSQLPINKIVRDRLVYRSWEDEQDWLTSMSGRSTTNKSAEAAERSERPIAKEQ